MKYRRALCLIVCAVLLCGCVFAQSLNGQTAVEELSSILGATPEKLLKANTVVPGDSTSDWAALAAARNDCAEDADTYLQGLWEYVSEAYQRQGGLDSVKATVWHRISLTVLALGADPTCFGEDGNGDPINLIADGTHNWTMTDSLGTQGTNAWIYALMVLDSMNYDVPENALYTRDRIIEEILSHQVADGGFHIGSGTSNVDVTAMALQALAPYHQSNDAVTQSVDKALAYLSEMQNAQGDFGNGGSESCSQVIMALCALGIDPETDERFVKEGGSAFNGLLLYHVSGGGFSHLLGDEADSLATVQAALAVTALERMRSGENGLYDFTDQIIEPFTPQTEIPIWIPIGTAIAILAIIIVCIGKGKRTCTV